MIANSATQTATLRSRLRDDTRKQHEAAEARPVECAMAAGRLTVEQYTEVLAQRYLVHVQLESLLDQLADKRPEVREMIVQGIPLCPLLKEQREKATEDADAAFARQLQQYHSNREQY